MRAASDSRPSIDDILAYGVRYLARVACRATGVSGGKLDDAGSGFLIGYAGAGTYIDSWSVRRSCV